LLPFLRQSMRTRGDWIVWLGAGMMAGLALVAAATFAERAVFTGLSDFTTGYRVVGTFSSMHMGGGISAPISRWRCRFCSSVCSGYAR
jgi:hypothetical protein